MFYGYRDGLHQIYVMDADGSNQIRLTNTSADEVNPSWSPDGSKIVFESGRDDGWAIYVMDTDGSNQTRLTAGNHSSTEPDWWSN